MKRLSLSLSFTLGLAQIIIAQVITAVPCDMLGMVMNVGSQENSISIYHSGQYMTSPQSENIFIWEFTDQDGNILHQETIVNQQTIAFGHNWSLTDTINVTVHFVNDSANLDNWYISEGMQPNGNSINCLFEDQIYWSTGDSTPWGSWTFINNNPGVDQNTINNCCINPDWINSGPCDMIYMPVLGCDGVEYSNSCLAENAGITSYTDVFSGVSTVLEWDCNQVGDDCVDDPDGLLESFQAYQCNDIVGSWFSWGCDDDLSVAVPGAPSGMWTIGDLCPQSCDECDEGNLIIGELFNKKTLLKKIDFLGREIKHNTEFQLHIYDDGSIEKKYILK